MSVKREKEDSAFRQRVLDLARETGFEFFYPGHTGEWMSVPRKFSEEYFHRFAALVLANLSATPPPLLEQYKEAVDRHNEPGEPTTDAGGEW